MPTFNQLLKTKRKAKNFKSKAPALGEIFNSKRKFLRV